MNLERVLCIRVKLAELRVYRGGEMRRSATGGPRRYFHFRPPADSALAIARYIRVSGRSVQRMRQA
jgi:hypothetical protein